MPEIRAFAERVLFSTTLEEKLAPPAVDLADHSPGTAIGTPGAPGRPDSLRFRRDGVRAELPGTHELNDDAHRGRLLHFFANHELLATELMALVLLKFPEAPREFRRGVVRTLVDEQRHTKLYLHRMRQCGVHFGDCPLNGFFWNCVAEMNTPLDYVTRLSLTFEQANLDYARHFSRIFARSGDDDTARILERIYQDEIGHVGYGLKWFRIWKNPRQSDWDAFKDHLPFPLSASRAKGGGDFNAEGRRLAGLDDAFIRQLRVFSMSKGRTPNVYWFNPGAETLAAPGNTTLTRTESTLASDLATLPAFLAKHDDIVLVPDRPPSTEFLTRLAAAGIDLPEFVALGTLPSDRKLHELRPWAWSPDAARTLAPLAGQTTTPSPSTGTLDPEAFSKLAHAGVLAKVLDSARAEFRDILCPHEQAGVPVTSPDELPRRRPLVIKAAFSTAGRNRIIVRSTNLDDKSRAWINRRLKAGQPLVAEPWLNRIFDFSIHFDHRPDGQLARRGLVHLENSESGQFIACHKPARFSDGMPESLRRLLHDPALPDPKRGWLGTLVDEHVAPHVGAFLKSTRHHGPCGIDAFFYRDADGRVRLKPLVEINPRFTMGRIALELARAHTSQGRRTTLRILPLEQLHEAGFPSIRDAAAHLTQQRPIQLRMGKIISGTLPLNDATEATRFLALLEVS